MATRTFEVLSPAGWEVTKPHKIVPGATFRVLDDAVQQFLAPEALNGDAGVYISAQVQTSVHFPVTTANGVIEKTAAFTA